MPWKDKHLHRDQIRTIQRRHYARHAPRKRAAAREYRREHLAEKAEYQRRYRAAKPDITRWIETRRNFGLEPGEVAAMLTAQANRCAVCRTADPGKSAWCIDHDHRTGEIRGILCAACNKAIGFFRDSPESMRAAADYVQNPPARKVLRPASEPPLMRLVGA